MNHNQQQRIDWLTNKTQKDIIILKENNGELLVRWQGDDFIIEENGDWRFAKTGGKAPKNSNSVTFSGYQSPNSGIYD